MASMAPCDPSPLPPVVPPPVVASVAVSSVPGSVVAGPVSVVSTLRWAMGSVSVVGLPRNVRYCELIASSRALIAVCAAEAASRWEAGLYYSVLHVDVNDRRAP